MQSKFIIFGLKIQLILSPSSTYGNLSSFPGNVLILFFKNEHIKEKDQLCTKMCFSYFTVTSRIDFPKQAGESKRKGYISCSLVIRVNNIQANLRLNQSLQNKLKETNFSLLHKESIEITRAGSIRGQWILFQYIRHKNRFYFSKPTICLSLKSVHCYSSLCNLAELPVSSLFPMLWH